MPKQSPIISYGGIVAAALALAACGSASKTSPSSGAPTTAESAASPSTTATGPAPLVKTKTDAKLGTILADASGKTLYTLTNNGQTVACTGPCLAVWPALTLPAGISTPSGTSDVIGLGVAAAPDGSQQLIVNGQPVYSYTQDAEADDAYGEGVQSFGGTWHVVKAGESVAPSSTPNAPATTTRRRGGGY